MKAMNLRKPARIAALLLLALAASVCGAAEIATLDQAWAYVAQPDSGKRWVVVSSQKNEGYFQCANMETYVQCPIPVSVRIAPTKLRVAPRESRGYPYPDLPGTTEKRYLSEAQAGAAKRYLAKRGVRFENVYSRIVDERGTVIGTGYDIRVILDFTYQEFAPLAAGYLAAVWKSAPQDGYGFKTD